MNQYNRNECIVFKSRETTNDLSNLSSGYPLRVNQLLIPSAESLYQATKYSAHPEIQREILKITSSLRVRSISRKYQAQTRPGWNEIKDQVMEWCLRLKLAQHWIGFGGVLLNTGDRQIVEQTSKNRFWGAAPSNKTGETLLGENRMGNLLTRLRDEYANDTYDHSVLSSLRIVAPPEISNLLILGQPVSQWKPGKPVDRKTLSSPVQWASTVGAHQS